MGHSRAEKSDSRERILRVAGRRFRERGLEGLGIAELMDEAGLTHGGFYRHFASRDDLVTHALGTALAANLSRLSKVAERSSKDPLHAMIDRYLDASHRDAPGDGCTIASLSADVARAGEATRTAYTGYVERFIELVAASIPDGSPKTKRMYAIGTLSAMVGALTLSRAVNDEKLADEFLKFTSHALKEWHADSA
ncbi:MAG: TetR/AcrR family transcriptional regulator [Gammaproteobacteria bacterium]|nr:TetR/AcrR family transcriptional regulator [Gammaproteobacteria bacterium]